MKRYAGLCVVLVVCASARYSMVVQWYNFRIQRDRSEHDWVAPYKWADYMHAGLSLARVCFLDYDLTELKGNMAQWSKGGTVGQNRNM